MSSKQKLEPYPSFLKGNILCWYLGEIQTTDIAEHTQWQFEIGTYIADSLYLRRAKPPQSILATELLF